MIEQRAHPASTKDTVLVESRPQNANFGVMFPEVRPGFSQKKTSENNGKTSISMKIPRCSSVVSRIFLSLFNVCSMFTRVSSQV